MITKMAPCISYRSAPDITTRMLCRKRRESYERVKKSVWGFVAYGHQVGNVSPRLVKIVQVGVITAKPTMFFQFSRGGAMQAGETQNRCGCSLEYCSPVVSVPTVAPRSKPLHPEVLFKVKLECSTSFRFGG